MAYQQQDLSALKNFIIPNSYDDLVSHIYTHKIALKITRERKSIHGNYTYNPAEGINRISINGNLNPYAFTITLIHEIAHCICFNNYKNKVQAHGKEWQKIYSDLLLHFLSLNIFPKDIGQALIGQIASPSASTCADPFLEKVLQQYNLTDDGKVYIESLKPNNYFQLDDGKIFKLIGKRRTRYICERIDTGNKYLFNAIHRVVLVKQ
jgi:SprT protein